MDDIEFALGASSDLGSLYRSAKSFSVDAPGHALLFLRGLAVKFCGALDSEFTERHTLEDRIRGLERCGLLKAPPLRHLRTLQRNGNISAHPEQFAHESHDYHALANASLGAARSLMEQLYLLRNEPVPEYDVLDVEPSGIRDMCYRAMMLGDIDAMYQAAVIAKAKADEADRQDTILLADNYGACARPHIDQAMFWFKQGADQKHPDCMYQYGLYLAQTRYAEKLTLQQGENLILQAAELGNADALVYSAGCLLEGSGIFEIDLDLAREYYERAAAQDHPQALGQLGAIYEMGKGCEPDPHAAARYTTRAAEAGFPLGQFNLFVLYAHGTGVERDFDLALQWLNRAVEQDFPAAVFNRACLAHQGLIQGETIQDAVSYYNRCAGFPDFRARAMLAVAEISLASSPTQEQLLDVAVKLQDCYESITNEGDPHEIKSDCLAASARAITRIRRHISVFGPDPKKHLNDVLLCTLFDQKGVPVVDRMARIGQFHELLNGVNSTRSGAKDRVIDNLLKEACITAAVLPVRTPSHVQAPAIATSRQGRNDLCQCGSGRKFKRCCGQ